MKSYLVIGAGRFGTGIVKELHKQHCEVVVCDKDERDLELLEEYATHAIVGDFRERDVLDELKIDQFNAVFIAIGSDAYSAILITKKVKERKAKKIIAKANNREIGEILQSLGADRVILPEEEAGRKVARQELLTGVIEYIEITKDISAIEMEVPEINDGLITIKKIARIPGERAKIAVESYDDRIDPVGACVGVKGSRIHGIVRELRNENIDVINYTSNIQLFIQRALSPAKVSSITMNEEDKKAEVYLKPEEVSLAIGKGGMNIKLASMLTEYTIDVYRELDENADDEDIYLDEFRDEIDGWVIDAIKAIGLDTAKAVLGAPRKLLVEKTDLEEETVDEVLSILSSEFEEE